MYLASREECSIAGGLDRSQENQNFTNTQLFEYIKQHKSANAIFGVLIRKQVVFPVIIQFIIHFFIVAYTHSLLFQLKESFAPE